MSDKRTTCRHFRCATEIGNSAANCSSFDTAASTFRRRPNTKRSLVGPRGRRLPCERPLLTAVPYCWAVRQNYACGWPRPCVLALAARLHQLPIFLQVSRQLLRTGSALLVGGNGIVNERRVRKNQRGHDLDEFFQRAVATQSRVARPLLAGSDLIQHEEWQGKGRLPTAVSYDRCNTQLAAQAAGVLRLKRRTRIQYTDA